MKIINIIFRVVLCLLLVSPILGSFGIFPPPTADMYNTAEAFAFITMLMGVAGYISYLMAIVCAVCIVLIITNRMALAAVLIAPITLNIVAFHAFIDGGLFTAGAIMANVLLLLNAYFLWRHRGQYRELMRKSTV